MPHQKFQDMTDPNAPLSDYLKNGDFILRTFVDVFKGESHAFTTAVAIKAADAMDQKDLVMASRDMKTGKIETLDHEKRVSGLKCVYNFFYSHCNKIEENLENPIQTIEYMKALATCLTSGDGFVEGISPKGLEKDQAYIIVKRLAI